MPVPPRPGAQGAADSGNLAAKAVLLLAARHGIEPWVGLHIDKQIPVAGGMAGGSADGARTVPRSGRGCPG